MFDWKDNLLVCAGLILGVAAVAALRVPLALTVGDDDEIVGGLVIALMLGPSALRRAVFGAPKLPAPRSSPVASLVSIVGLFATLAGVALLALVALDAPRAFGSPPDFAAEAKAQLAEVDALVGALPMAKPQGEAELERAKASLRESWAEEQAGRRARILQLGAVGLLLAALGSLAAWWRYPRPATEVRSLLGGGVDGGDD